MSYCDIKMLLYYATIQQKYFLNDDKIISNTKGGMVMYKKVEISTCRTFVDNEREYIYRYFLIESNKKININEHIVTVPCYGIDVIREELKEGKIVDIYENMLDCVSSVSEKVVSLIEYLRNNEVSPVHLIDIVGEYADEWVDDFDRTARVLLESMAVIM